MMEKDLGKESFCNIKGNLGTFKAAEKLIFNPNQPKIQQQI